MILCSIVILEYAGLYIIIVVIYSYFERENDKVLKFHVIDFSFKGRRPTSAPS